MAGRNLDHDRCPRVFVSAVNACIDPAPQPSWSGYETRMTPDPTDPATNHKRAFITVESITRFKAEYETLGQMAAKIGIRPMHLA